jgi:hypothetical protein
MRKILESGDCFFRERRHRMRYALVIFRRRGISILKEIIGKNSVTRLNPRPLSRHFGSP